MTSPAPTFANSGVCEYPGYWGGRQPPHKPVPSQTMGAGGGAATLMRIVPARVSHQPTYIVTPATRLMYTVPAAPIVQSATTPGLYNVGNVPAVYARHKILGL